MDKDDRPTYTSSKQCSICGNIYHNVAFKGGCVCEDCVEYIKSHKTDQDFRPYLKKDHFKKD